MDAKSIAVKLLESYPSIRLEKTRIENIKKKIESLYMKIKNDSINDGKEFDGIFKNNIIVHEKRIINYTWRNAFYEELIDCGMAHKALKHGYQLNKRFDLSEYELPKNPEKQSLGFSPSKLSPKEEEEICNITQNDEEMWESKDINELVEIYIRLKKKFDLKKNFYDSSKSDLLKAMKSEDIPSIAGFYLRDEEPQYDFSKMYSKEFEEKIFIVTNGEKSIDLFNCEITDVIPDQLYNVERVSRRFGNKKLEVFREALGDDFYFVIGNKIEDNILTRFPVSTSKVEDMVLEGLLSPKILKTERFIKSEKDVSLSFEIITEDAAIRRSTVQQTKQAEKALIYSGYYANEPRLA